MNWSYLINFQRLGRAYSSQPESGRSEFQKDYDRIIFSSAFRRLQNKTQVVPLPASDFVRNRLTHSLETSSVGRSLGYKVAEHLIKKYKNEGIWSQVHPIDIASVVSAACLAHDIGNPPFGHAGEDAISAFFKEEGNKMYLDGLNKTQISDLENFEGNAAGFRILTHTSPVKSSIRGGIGLTLTTLAAFMKYPKLSNPILKKSGLVSQKKYSVFYSEKEVLTNISSELNLIKSSEGIYKRHPFAFLVEAADDICYHILDFEDGFSSGLIPFELIADKFGQIIPEEKLQYSRYKHLVDESTRVAYLRANVINELVQQCSEVFITNEKELLSGKFEQPLIEQIDATHALEDIKSISVKKLYRNKEVLKTEAMGYHVIHGLLDTFLEAVFCTERKLSPVLAGLLPAQFKPEAADDPYEKILKICMFVSGMTDTYAVNLFKKLKGISG